MEPARKFYTVFPIESVRSAHIFDTTICADFAIPGQASNNGSDGDRDDDGDVAAAESDATPNGEKRA